MKRNKLKSFLASVWGLGLISFGLWYLCCKAEKMSHKILCCIPILVGIMIITMFSGIIEEDKKDERHKQSN